MEKFFSVIYDIQRPDYDKMKELRKSVKRGLATKEETKEFERLRKWDKYIGSFVDKLMQIGYRINWSVYIVPDKYKRYAEELVDEYNARFDSIGVRTDIYILEYSPNSNDIIKNKVILRMKLELEKLYKKLKEAKTGGDRAVIMGQIRLIEKLSYSFGIDKEIIDFIHKQDGRKQKTLEVI